VWKRLRDPEYAAVCRARLHRYEAQVGPYNPTACHVEPVETPLPPVRNSPLAPALLRHPILTGSMFAAVLMFPMTVVIDPPEAVWDDLWRVAASAIPSFSVSTSPLGPTIQTASRREEEFGGVYAITPESGPPAEPSIAFTSLRTVVGTDGPPEIPTVTVPEVTTLLTDELAAAGPEQAYQTPVTALAAAAPEKANQTPVIALAAPTGSASKLVPADRDFLIHKGNEMLARGDVAGARLVFQRAAESGDARAADGMARTFDPKVLRMLRVFGIRPDPEKAALWYARSKALETVVSTR
jgi:hypothetical protein